MNWVFAVVFCVFMVSCCAEDGDSATVSRSDSQFSRGAYLVESRNDFTTPANDSVTEERTVTSEQRKDGIHHKVTITKKIRVPYTVHVEKRIPKIIEVPVDKPFNVYVPKPYPVIVEKKVPYEIKVPQPQPYTVEKKVPYPVKVLVDKPYTLHVPKPYPVEVEKKFEFEVEKKVPVEVKVPVERRYPVHVIVEKEVKFPVEKKVPVPVKVPHDKPIPIHVTKHVPVHVDKPVPYTLEKVVTYPVKVPFRIPIKVHYQEGGAMDEMYSNSYSTPELQNLEWSEAMTSATKAVHNFEQNHFRSPVRQGFSIPSNRGFYQKNAFYLSSSSKDHQNQQKSTHNHNTHNPSQHQYRPPTNLNSAFRLSPTYEVNEIQPQDTFHAVPFLSKPDSEVIVPQLLIGTPPPQSTNMLLSQAALASIVHHRNNVSNTSHKPNYNSKSPSFTISQTVQHSPAVNPHQFHYISGQDQNLQAIKFVSPQNSFTQSDHNVISQTQSAQVPSATFFRSAPQPASNVEHASLAKLVIPTSEGLNSHQNTVRKQQGVGSILNHVSHQSNQVAKTHSDATPTFTTTPSLTSQNHHHHPSQQQSPVQQSAPQPPQTPNQNADPDISSSYIGSKTLLGGQELVYTSSVQHSLPPSQ